MVIIDQHVLMSMMAVQEQRNCGFRVETETTNLRWENLSWDSEDDPHGELFGLKCAHCSDLEIKNR